MARRERIKGREGREGKEREKKRQRQKNEWMNNSEANTVETRRGLNICFANGRQSTTGKKRNVHIQDGFYYIHIYTRVYAFANEGERFMTHPFYYYIIFYYHIVEAKERINFFFFYSLVRHGNHSINHSDSFSTVWYTYTHTYMCIYIHLSLTQRKHDIELDLIS